MRVSGFLSGGSPIVRRYQIAASVLTAGIPLLGDTSATTAGLKKPTTTSLVGMAGIAVDTATYSTTQLGAGGGGGGSFGAPGSAGGGIPASADAYVGVVINPDVLITARLSGGATSGTALTTYAVTTAQSAGLTISSTNLGTNTMAGGTSWCMAGANANARRKIAGAWTNSVSFVVVVPYDYAIAVGDTFCVCPLNPMGGLTTAITAQLTSDFTEIDATIAVGTGATNVVVTELLLRDSANNGTTDSWATFSPTVNHMLYKAAGA